MEKANASTAESSRERWGLSDEIAESSGQHRVEPKTSPVRIFLICSAIFIVATGSRLLSWQDNRFEARKVQTAVTEGYKHTARLLQQGGVPSFFGANSSLNDPNHLGHPPGYSILIAVVFSGFGESDAALQIVQMLADSTAAVVVFLIALSLLNVFVATIAGLLIAVAPQFTYNSVMLLPDSLSVLPILLAVYVLARSCRRPSPVDFIVAGALVGVSCWLRANALLLAPFMSVAVLLLYEKGRRIRYGLAFVAGAILVIAPLTVRNFVVYDHFIPVSLGAGQTLLEGIADYDEERTLGIPNTDMGLMKWEAEFYKRPDYYGTLFDPDGVWRERSRLARGFAVIRSHPFWFMGVMVKRAGSMLRLERVRVISADPPVTHSLAAADQTPPVWTSSAHDMIATATIDSNSVKASVSGEMSRLEGDELKDQMITAPISISAHTDYVFKIPIRIEQGRISLSVVGGDNHLYASSIVEFQDWKTTAEQPLLTIELPFVSGGQDQVRLVFANAGQRGVASVVEIGRAELYQLGPASFGWARAPRLVVRGVQKLFITAVMLPLALFGLFFMIRARMRNAIITLLVVPAYYLCVQSALHTEYRYVLAIHYLLFVFVAVALYKTAGYLWRARLRIPILRRANSQVGKGTLSPLEG